MENLTREQAVIEALKGKKIGHKSRFLICSYFYFMNGGFFFYSADTGKSELVYNALLDNDGYFVITEKKEWQGTLLVDADGGVVSGCLPEELRPSKYYDVKKLKVKIEWEE